MNDSQLDQLLKSCGYSSTPPRFTSDVWKRIAVEPDSAGALPVWKRFLAETFTGLSQPIGAFATCSAFVIAGIITGIGQRPESLPAEVQYIQSISPFIHTGQ